MSRIITTLTCTHCHFEWNGYISFGHPDSDFDYKWSCQACGTENTHRIKAWIDMSDQGSKNGVQVYSDDPTSILRIFTDKSFVDPKAFTWRQFEDQQATECVGMYLTLEDISDQLQEQAKSSHIGVVYVWVEHPLYGVIYQYGNYSDDMWRIHGKTNGYA